MATALDALTPPQGWDIAHVALVADINKLDPGAAVEIETSPDFQTLSLFGLNDVIGSVPDISTELDIAAQQHGSRVYAVILLHHTDFDVFGVQVDRYRFLIVHSQFQALLVLVALPVVIGLVAVWLECHSTPDQCGQLLQTNAHDASQALCNIFGASCALQSLGVVIIGASLLSLGFAALLFMGETGIAQRMGLKGPSLPAVRSPAPPQVPRVAVGLPGLPAVSVSSGGRGRRGGGSR